MPRRARKPWFVNVRVHHLDPGGSRAPHILEAKGWSQRRWTFRFRHEARERFELLAAGDLAMLQQTLGRWVPRANVTHAEIVWGSLGEGGKDHGRVEVR